MKKRLPLSDAGNEIPRSKQKRLPSFAGRAGLLGAAAAVPGLQAGTVQITQDGNELTVTGGTFANNLDADYTGDDVDDARDLVGIPNDIGMQDAIRLDISYTYMRVGWSSGVGGFFIAKPTIGQVNYPSVPFTRNFLIPVEFTDSRINGGVASNGFMHVKAFHTTFNTFACELVRLIFDDADTAAPGGVNAGTTYPEWQEFVPPPPSTNPPTQTIDIVIAQKIAKTKKKIKKLKKSGKKAKAKKLQKKLKKLQAQL